MWVMMTLKDARWFHLGPTIHCLIVQNVWYCAWCFVVSSWIIPWCHQWLSTCNIYCMPYITDGHSILICATKKQRQAVVFCWGEQRRLFESTRSLVWQWWPYFWSQGRNVMPLSHWQVAGLWGSRSYQKMSPSWGGMCKYAYIVDNTSVTDIFL